MHYCIITNKLQKYKLFFVKILHYLQLQSIYRSKLIYISRKTLSNQNSQVISLKKTMKIEFSETDTPQMFSFP